MTKLPEHEPMSRLDAATSARLAQLGAMPVDTSALQAKLRQAMRDEQPPARLTVRARPWTRTVMSIAAMIVIAGLIGWLAMDGGTGTAVAAPNDMAQLHEEVAKDIAPTMRATSVEQANQVLAEQFAGDKPIVQDMHSQMHACCLRSYAGTSLSCVMLERDGKLISIAVADADRLRTPKGQTVERDGRSFTLHTANGVNMVMSNAGGRWLCVMGDASSDELLDVAGNIRF